MKVSLQFGKTYKQVEIPQSNLIGVLRPNDIELSHAGVCEVKRALKNPIGTPALSEIIKKGEKIAIITSDITRPMPSKIVLPEVIRELTQAGIPDTDIVVVFGMGVHRHHTDEERKKLVGEDVFSRIRCVDSDGTDCILLGKTSRGTPVEVFRPVVEADRRICLGNIEYHYFAGYSGGAKAIMPGVSTRAAIQANHSRMVESKAMAGVLNGNPVREDIDEVARFVSIDFIVNVVLDEQKTIIKAVAGHFISAHREGCAFLDRLFCAPITQKSDIVVVSAGGHPKDINLYQAQKALDNAKHAVKDGGTIILVASCMEGLGEHVFEDWMLHHDHAADMIEHIASDFQLGGHKAAAIALVLEKAEVYLISDLELGLVSNIFLMPFDDLQKAFDAAFTKHGSNATVLVIPFGGSTLPKLLEE
jgi:nickel-dependent lactate racemase